MAARLRAYFRTPIYPFPGRWSGGPGLDVSVIRFGVWAGWRVTPSPDESEPRYATQLALLTTELPYSVLPWSLRESIGARVEALSPQQWHSQPVPRWCGVTCDLGVVEVRLPPVGVDDSMLFNLLVLLPDRDPPGPRLAHALIGQEFLLHYGWKLKVAHRQIRFQSGEPSGRRDVDSSVPCGQLSLV